MCYSASTHTIIWHKNQSYTSSDGATKQSWIVVITDWISFLMIIGVFLFCCLFPQKWLPGWFHLFMMAKSRKGNKATSCGLLNNYRYLCKKAMMLRAVEDARAKRKCQQNVIVTNTKRKIMEHQNEPLGTNKLVKKSKWSDRDQESQRTDVSKPGLSASEQETSDPHRLDTAPRDSWEVDSGFSSEGSPPASGRSSPCLSSTTVVALDCEMVGTGPGGRCSELARCSILDYHGNILYDKYVRPCQPVTDYRTPWSGIRRHHLQDATPFSQARDEVRPS